MGNGSSQLNNSRSENWGEKFHDGKLVQTPRICKKKILVKQA